MEKAPTSALSFADNLDDTRKKAEHIFSLLDPVEDIGRKPNLILEGLFPSLGAGSNR
jgi:hypothetical protein